MNVELGNLGRLLRTVSTQVGQLRGKNNKLVFCLNYHQIGRFEAESPLSRLHTVPERLFRWQVGMISKLGRVVSLSDCLNPDRLDKLNFIITFDDVSRTVLRIKPVLERWKLPYSICPCTSITTQGYGIRDKVYWVLARLPREQIRSYVSETLGKEGIVFDPDTFDFYRFTKSTVLHPREMDRLIINPLFEKIPNISTVIQNQRPYLSWDDIREHFIGDELVTIVNHSHNHDNMEALTQQDRLEDVKQSVALFDRFLGHQPKFFALPFGNVNAELAYDLLLALRPYGYNGILWVARGGLITAGRYEHQLVNILRIHTPTDLMRFLMTLISAVPRSTVFDFTPAKPTSASKFTIVENPDLNHVFAFENIIRPGKDYSCSRSYYGHLCRENPYRRGKPEAFAVMQNNRVTGIGYNFYLPFSFFGESLTVNYWSGWRKLENCPASASSLLLLQAMELAPMIASHRPSRFIEDGFRGNYWRRVTVSRVILRPRASVAQLSKAEIEMFETCPRCIDSLTRSLPERLLFTVERSIDLYEWRFDDYPLAESRYLLLSESGLARGFLALLTLRDKLAVSDFVVNNECDFALLYNALQSWAHSEGISRLIIDTSLPAIVQWLEKENPVSVQTYGNYYYIGAKVPSIESHREELARRWENLTFHETQMTSDLLLRPQD